MVLHLECFVALIGTSVWTVKPSVLKVRMHSSNAGQTTLHSMQTSQMSVRGRTQNLHSKCTINMSGAGTGSYPNTTWSSPKPAWRQKPPSPPPRPHSCTYRPSNALPTEVSPAASESSLRLQTGCPEGVSLHSAVYSPVPTHESAVT